MRELTHINWLLPEQGFGAEPATVCCYHGCYQQLYCVGEGGAEEKLTNAFTFTMASSPEYTAEERKSIFKNINIL